MSKTGPKPWTTEKFISQAVEVHGDRYDYSSVEYKNARTKVKIICQEHGEFEQNPKVHINGSGCPRCAGVGIYTTDEFVKKAKEIHKDKYDYSLVEYKNSYTKIKIICSIHGIFEQAPNSHLFGKECSKCSIGNDIYSFIEKAEEIYGNKYDYSLVEYKNAQTKVKIICPDHGVFEKRPDTFLTRKHGCLKCLGEDKLDIKQRQLIYEATQIHNNKYNYSLVEYKDSRTKVKIICPIHGIFKQRFDSHVEGQGCPVCRESSGEKEIAKYLTDKNIKFKKEKRFQGCKNINPLPFDFYLPEHNLCIEYDGKQHFESVEHFGGEEGLKYTQYNDNIKNKYCEDNNIDLLRISYKENILNALEVYFEPYLGNK